MSIPAKNDIYYFLNPKGLLSLIFFFVITIAFLFTPIFQAYIAAAAGPPQVITLQGRLTDANGDLVGGSSGTTYYFKFSLHDASSGGTKLWPPTASCTHSLTVREGVFTAHIGDTSECADVLDYDFRSSEDVYVEIEVSSDNNTFETLAPRQRVTSSAFSLLSAGVSAPTTQSTFGTTTPIGNSLVTVEATSSSAIPLSLRGAAGQVANIFNIEDSTGSSLFSVDSSGVLSLASALGELYGGTGQTTYSTGDILYADGPNSLTRLSAGSNGQVLKLSGGVPSWETDNVGSGGSGLWATTTDSLATYPVDTTDVVLIGSNATTSTGNIFEVVGASLFDGITVGGTITIGGDSINEFAGAGLTVSGNALTLDGSLYTSDDFTSDLAATSSVDSITTLSNLSITESQISDLDHWDTTDFVSALAATSSIDSITTLNNLSITESQISDLNHTTDTNLTQEEVEDFAGGMVDSNTETLITVTYQDGDGTLDFVVDNDLSNYDNTTSGFITDYTVTEGDVTAHEAALTITESQISDLVHWDIDDFVASLAATSSVDSITTLSNLSITEDQISNLDHFTGADITGSETAFDGWDKNASDDYATADFTSDLAATSSVDSITTLSNLSITESQISDLDHWDIDDFVASLAATSSVDSITTLNNLSITESQISDLGSYITGVAWGDITGTLSNQTDLQSALDGKISVSTTSIDSITELSNLATVGTLSSGTLSLGSLSYSGTLGDSNIADNLTISSSGSVADGALSANVSLLGNNIEDGEVDDDITIDSSNQIVAPTFSADNASATSTFSGGLDVLAINQTGSATSTFNNGIDLANGCFAVNGTCITGGGGGTWGSITGTLSDQTDLQNALDAKIAIGTTSVDSITELTNLSITENQISDLSHYTDTDTADYINASTTIWNNTTEASLESFLTDVTNVFTNNDGALSDDDITDDFLGDLANVSTSSTQYGNFLAWDGSNWTNFSTSTQLNVALSDTTGTLGETSGGTGQTTYSTGDILYADGPNSLTVLSAGSNGQVLKLSGGVPSWGVDNSGGGGGSGLWATTTDDLAIYPNDTSDVVLIGSNATTSTGNIFEVVGASLFDDITVGSTITIGGDSINEFAGAGLTVSGNALTLDGALDDDDLTDDQIATLSDVASLSDDTVLTREGGSVVSSSTISAFLIDASIARDSELHDAVTLAGGLDYLTISGQEITRNAIDLSTDVTGTLDESNIDSAIARDSELYTTADFTSDLAATSSVDSIVTLSNLSITESQVSDLDHFTGADITGSETAFDGWDKNASDDYATADFVSDLAATTSVDSITTLSNLSITESQISDLDTYLTDITGESLADLSDVDGSPNTNDILYWDGDSWANTATTSWDTDTNLTENEVEAFIFDADAETITGNWDNTANPWADNEVADDLTISSSGSVADGALSANVSLLGSSIDLSSEVTGTLDESNIDADIARDSELYTTTDFTADLAATSSVDSITTLSNLSITESQISNLGSYLTSVAWGDITGTLSNQTDLQDALDGKIAVGTTSVDSITTLSNLSITESQISNLDHFTGADITGSETAFDGWDKNASDDYATADFTSDLAATSSVDSIVTLSNLSITESQVSDLDHFTGADITGSETAFDGWDKNAADDYATADFVSDLAATTSVDSITTLSNLSITENQISDLSHYTDTDTADYINASTTIWNNTTEASLESFLTDVTNVFTNNDGALDDDDLTDDSIETLSDVSSITKNYGDLLGWNGSAWVDFATSSLAINLSDTVGTLGETSGGTGQTTYSTGDVLYADGPNSLTVLSAGSNGSVLKLSGGVPTWGTDSTGGGGGSGLWATTTDDLAVYPADTSDVVVIGNNATSSTGNIFEVVGASLFDGITADGATTLNSTLSVTGQVTLSNTTGGLLEADGSGVLTASSTVNDFFIADDLTISSSGSVADGALSANVSLFGSDVNANELASEDFGDFTCNGTTCSLDTDTVSDNEIDYTAVTLNDFTNDADFVTWTSATSSLWQTSGLLSTASSTVTGDFSAGGDALFVDQSAGRVGVGTTSPKSSLHIEGTGADLRLSSETANEADSNSIIFEEGASGAGIEIRYDGAAPNNGGLKIFELGGSPLVTFGRDGAVGIGTESPDSRLDVGGGNISLNGGYLSNDGGSEGVSVSNTGNVGIGTTGGTVPLHVVGADFPVLKVERTAGTNDDINSGFVLNSAFGSDVVDGFGGGFLFSITDSGVSDSLIARFSAVRDGADDSGALLFETYNTGTRGERMRITSDGNVGIGTTSPGTLLSLGDTGNDTINISTTATSTFGNGINIRSGCFAVNGTCITGGGGGTWGSITGTLSDQTDLQNALDAKIAIGTTSVDSITTLSNLSITEDQISDLSHYTSSNFISDLAATSSVDSITTLSNLASVGALDAGSITANFGNIDIGSSNLDADGTITFGGISDGVIQTQNGALSATTTIRDYIVADDLTIDSSAVVTAPHFAADSTTATSTFAGDVAIGGRILQVGNPNSVHKIPSGGPASGFLVVDKTNAASDASVLFASEGDVQWEIGTAGGDDLFWKRVTGTEGSYVFENVLFMDYETARFGIGTEAPGSKFEIASTSPGERVGLRVANKSTSGVDGASLQLVSENDGHVFYVGTDAGLNGTQNAFLNWGSFGTGIFLDSSGNVGINTTSLTAGADLTAGNIAVTDSDATSTFSGGLDVLAINQTGSATSTFNNGIDLANGCFAVNGTCITGGGGGTWGSITGTLSDQTDLQNALDAKIAIGTTSVDSITELTNLSITESQVSDLDHFTGADITGSETAFDGWDKNASDDYATADFVSDLAATTSVDSITTLSNLSITESQVSDLDHFTGADITGSETAFDGWDKNASDDYATADFVSDLAATTSVDSITTLSNLASVGTLNSGTLALDSLSYTGTLPEANIDATIARDSELHDAVTLAGSLDYITISGQQITRNAIDLSTDTTGTLGETSGGTGQTTYSTGDILYASGSNTLTKLTAATDGNILALSSGAPAWVSTSTFFTTNDTTYAYSNSSTSTIPNNTPYAWTIATSTDAEPWVRIDTDNGGQAVFGRTGGNVVIGDVGTASNLVFEESSTISGQGGNTITLGQTGDTFNAAVNFGVSSSTPWKALSVNGNVAFQGLTASTGAGSICLSSNNELVYNDGSDSCLSSLRDTKEDITELDVDGLSAIEQLRPVSFVYIKGSDRTRYGFIAEEVSEVNEHLPTYNANNELTGIDDRAVLSVTVKAVQELHINLETIASTTASTTPQSEAFAEKFFDAVLSKVQTFLADTANGVTSIVANTFQAKERICVDGECLTASDVRTLLELAEGGSSVSQTSAQDSGVEEDTEAPVITIAGNNPAEVAVGDTYNDLGVTVTDNEDENLGIKASVNGEDVGDQSNISIDTSEAGTHEIEYRATDNAGNTGTATRTVIVGEGTTDQQSTPNDSSEEEPSGQATEETTTESEPDTTPPEITVLGELSIEIEVGDEYTDAGAEAVDPSNSSGQATDLTDEIITDNLVDTSVAGEYTVTYTVADAAGNEASASRNVTVVEPETVPVEEVNESTTTPAESSGESTEEEGGGEVATSTPEE